VNSRANVSIFLYRMLCEFTFFVCPYFYSMTTQFQVEEMKKTSKETKKTSTHDCYDDR